MSLTSGGAGVGRLPAVYAYRVGLPTNACSMGSPYFRKVGSYGLPRDELFVERSYRLLLVV